VLEVYLVRLLQFAIEVLQLVIQFDLLLDEAADTDQHVLDGSLAIDLLYLDAAEIF
jgi:hypothetical protein